MSIRIITDSTSDITQKEAQAKNIQVVPLGIVFEDTQYQDGITIHTEEFYKKLEESKDLPHSSQPSPDQFLTLFEDAKKSGDSVLVITLASELSGTYQSALLAKQLCEYDNIHLIDSQSVTIGLKLLVEVAISLRDGGASIEEIVSKLEIEKKRLFVFAAVDTLLYLKKGGRLSGTALIAGTLLSIKPIVKVEAGVVQLAAKAKGKKASFSKIKELIEETGGIDFDMPFTLGYTGSRESLDEFYSYMKESYQLSNPTVGAVGSTVGVHAGPGASAIAFFAKN